MILDLNQKSRQPNPVFEGVLNNKIVITGKGSTQSNDAFVEYGNRKYYISSKPHRERINDKNVIQVIDLTLDSHRIGYIYPDIVEKKKVLFLSFGYDYFVFNFLGNDYNVYEVGFGADQHYICVYSGDETIAIIKKYDKKINYCDRYTIYSLDRALLLPMSILTLYFDCIRYPDHGEIIDEANTNDSFLTTQRELNAKFDETFIEKVKNADEHSN